MADKSVAPAANSNSAPSAEEKLMEEPETEQQQQQPSSSPMSNQHSSGGGAKDNGKRNKVMNFSSSGAGGGGAKDSGKRSKIPSSTSSGGGGSYFSTEGTRGSILEDDENWQFQAEETSAAQRSKARNVVIQAVNVDEMAEEDFPDTRMDFTKSGKEVAEIIRLINSVILFQGYEDDELRSVIAYMYRRKVAKGEVVIRQGEEGDAFYVIRSGKYDCTVQEGAKQSHVRTYEDAGYFGDLALIHHAPRAATITALSNGELWVLNAMRYVWLKKRQAVRNAECFEQVIRRIPMFSSSLTNSHISRLIDAIEVLTLHDGEVICRQGEPGDAMYFILDGSVSINVGGKEVGVMGTNGFFGERALILDEGRAATCTVKAKAKLAKLPKESFEMLIPDAVVDSMRKYMAKAYAAKNPPK